MVAELKQAISADSLNTLEENSDRRSTKALFLWIAIAIKLQRDVQHNVDTYSLQHPDPYMVSAKSFAAHLTGMCCFLEYDNDRNLLRLLQRWLDGKKQLDKPELFEHLGDLTIAHIIDARDAEEHLRLVQEWAADVWRAYALYHALAREWIERILFEKERAASLLSKKAAFSTNSTKRGPE